MAQSFDTNFETSQAPINTIIGKVLQSKYWFSPAHVYVQLSHSHCREHLTVEANSSICSSVGINSSRPLVHTKAPSFIVNFKWLLIKLENKLCDPRIFIIVFFTCNTVFTKITLLAMFETFWDWRSVPSVLFSPKVCKNYDPQLCGVSVNFLLKNKSLLFSHQSYWYHSHFSL